MRKYWVLIVILLCLMLPFGTALAQEEPALRLSLLRNFGSSLGGSIQGTFTYRVSGPDELARVEFLMDGEPIGDDTEAPFRWRFHTDNFSQETHTMSAVGYTSDGRTLQSNTIQRQFISGGQSNQLLMWLLIPILVLAVGGRLVTSWIANRNNGGQPAISGPVGGTICPKCERPFAMHIWGFNVAVGKYDRCPHCGKWSLVRRVAPHLLQEAADAFAASKPEEPAPASTPDDAQSLAKRLDDSRFDNN